MKTLYDLEIEEKIAQLRRKWVEAKKKEDLTMMGIYERQAKALKISQE